MVGPNLLKGRIEEVSIPLKVSASYIGKCAGPLPRKVAEVVISPLAMTVPLSFLKSHKT